MLSEQVPKGFIFQALRSDGINAHVIAEAAVSDFDKVRLPVQATEDAKVVVEHETAGAPKRDKNGHLRGKKRSDTLKPLSPELTLEGA